MSQGADATDHDKRGLTSAHFAASGDHLPMLQASMPGTSWARPHNLTLPPSCRLPPHHPLPSTQQQAHNAARLQAYLPWLRTRMTLRCPS